LPAEREVEANKPVLTIIADVLAGRNLAAYCGVLGDMRSIAPILPVMVGRSLATIGVLLFRARTSCSDCLASLRPSERSGSVPAELA
jgi:hypothetical protein